MIIVIITWVTVIHLQALSFYQNSSCDIKSANTINIFGHRAVCSHEGLMFKTSARYQTFHTKSILKISAKNSVTGMCIPNTCGSTVLSYCTYTLGVFIDLLIWLIMILLSQLHYYNIRGIALKWFESYLLERKQFVSFDGHSSSYKSSTRFCPWTSAVLDLYKFTIFVKF